MRRYAIAAEAAAAACLVVLAAVSAQAKDIRVATLNPATGQYVVEESALKPTFADGVPVQSSPRRFDGSDTWVLVRCGSTAPGQCRSQATPVVVRADAAYVRVDSMPHIAPPRDAHRPVLRQLQVRPGPADGSAPATRTALPPDSSAIRAARSSTTTRSSPSGSRRCPSRLRPAVPQRGGWARVTLPEPSPRACPERCDRAIDGVTERLLPRIVEHVEVRLVHDVGVAEPRIRIGESERLPAPGVPNARG